MCGLVGAWSLAPGARPAVPAAALELLRHRGPDGAAWHVDERGHLGFRRLAIIDVAAGMQPLANEDGQIVAAVNGEIYNHHALRRELADGHRLRTGSDAEVVVHGYEAWGDRVFAHLRGMFAAAIVDRAGDRLVLARDRVGKKPLYYRRDGELLVFASEIRPLLVGRSPAVDREALDDYLRFGYVPAPRTMFAGIRKLPAGCLLVAEGGRIEVRRWAPPFARGPASGGDAAGWAEAVRETLAEAVAVRLESEVPLGFLLSGGIDSAAVFALGAQALTTPAHAFTIGFDDAEVDETEAAASVAARYRARHTVRVVTRAEAPDLGAVITRCEEPVATDALLPTDRVFSSVRAAGITTILAGEGSDEIFAGYRKFERAAQAAITDDRAAWLASGSGPLARYLATEEFCFPSQGERAALIGDAAADGGFDWLEDTVAGLDPLAQMLAIEVALRLPDRINHRLDRLSMAHSIEARAPFMDPAVIELALQVPHSLRVRGGVGKWILREGLAGDLPAPVRRARKAPFRAPDAWFVAGGGISSAEVHEAGLVAPAAVDRLRLRARAGDAAARERLYSLTVLHLWHRHLIRDQAIDVPAALSA